MSDGKVIIDIELDADQATAQADREGRKAGQRFSDGFKQKIAKLGAAAGAAIGAAGAALVKESLELFAQYEQLAGGVDTLFKDSSDTVKANADAAFKTAGLSANQYMETVTSFSASLIKSLGDDTEAAAAYADMAIKDMADNANKMGTSIDTIQQTYSSFARGNFAMLDNLKLGYGGTKAEMEKLLADAEAIKAANGEMVQYSIDSFADMVEAIHVVQESMGIAGATAQEAATTIEGSVASMQAAWENWLVGLGNTEADMVALTNALVDAVIIAAGNIIPRIGIILATLGTTIQQSLMDMLTQLIEQLHAGGPEMGEAALEMLLNIVTAINEVITLAVDAILLLIASLIVAIVNKGIDFFNAAVEVMGKLAQGVKEGAKHVVSEIQRGIEDGINKVKESVTGWIEAGKAIVDGLIQGIVSKATDLANAAINAVKGAVDGAKSFLGINSPSKLMRDQIGKPMAEGVAVGFERYNPFNQISQTLRTGTASLAVAGNTYNTTTQTVNFNQPMQSAAQVARAMRLNQTYGLAGAR